VTSRRQASHKRKRSTASDRRDASTQERFARLETAQRELAAMVNINFKRIAALQAEVDHLTAKREP